jgi:hypothetical protein
MGCLQIVGEQLESIEDFRVRQQSLRRASDDQAVLGFVENEVG